MQNNTLQMKRALRTALLVLLLSVAGMGKGYAYDFEVNGIYYNKTSDNGVSVTYRSQGVASYSGSITIPSTVKYGNETYTVKSIGESAFEGCSGLISVTTTASRTSLDIRNRAFFGCDHLSSIILKRDFYVVGSSAWEGCNGNIVLTIGEVVNGIPDNAFSGCIGLRSIRLNSDDTNFSIGNSAFKDCSNLISVYYTSPSDSDGIRIGNYAFSGCSNLSTCQLITGAHTIGNNAFYGCESLNSVGLCNNFHSSITTVGDCAFSGCTGLQSIGIGTTGNSGQLKLGNSVFSNCTGLREIHYSARSFSMGNNTWDGCTGPVTLTINDGIYPSFIGFDGLTSVIFNRVSSIGGFRDCRNLSSVTFDNNVQTISSEAFQGCTSLSSIVFPNSLTKIGSSAFEGCTSLSSIAFPSSLTEIGSSAFEGCTGIVDFDIPNTVTSIYSTAFNTTGWYNVQPSGILYLSKWCLGYKGEYPSNLYLREGTEKIANSAFSNCNGLVTLNIPKSVTSIGFYAFSDCIHLTEINYNAISCTMMSGWLSNCNSLTTVNIGNDTKTIPDSAFQSCNTIETVNFVGNSVTTISKNAFSGCSGLTSFVIPKTIREIQSSAFSGCNRLAIVYYNVEKDLDAATNVFNNCPNLTTLHIGADVQEIGANIFSGCTGVHLIVALGPTPATLVGGAFADFADNSILMVSCGNKLNYFSVWNMFDFNNILEDCGEYSINLNNIGTGGNVSASTTQAQMGQEVQLTVSPNAGMKLSSISVCNATDPTQNIPVYPIGKANSAYGFIMPPYGVSVNATFTAGTSVEENDNVPVSVYPNPITNHVHIEAENLKHISISNLLGQTIYDSNANGDAFEYDFSNHNTGIYLIRIETTSGVAVKKVSVAR